MSSLAPSTHDNARWYAIWTRSKHEKTVCNALQRHSIPTFLPTVSRWTRWKDRKKHLDWPLFPGYCFAQFTPMDRIRVLSCNGVVTVLGDDRGPIPIADDEILSLQRLIHSKLAFDPCPHIREGGLVDVVHGPLRGVVGRLVRKGAHARLVLSVTLINQAIWVEVDSADVRPH